LRANKNAKKWNEKSKMGTDYFSVVFASLMLILQQFWALWGVSGKIFGGRVTVEPKG